MQNQQSPKLRDLVEFMPGELKPKLRLINAEAPFPERVKTERSDLRLYREPRVFRAK